uniref:Uncharacterized protein n=1 Tax=Homalodisca liturata TaxID=320908 RepID=A0A1B6I8B6_9HEMI
MLFHLCFFFIAVIQYFALACENLQCQGPKYYRSNCCEGYVCVPRRGISVLVCVNQRERSRVLNFDEVLKTANDYAKKEAKKERMNYEMDTASNIGFQLEDLRRGFQPPQTYGTNQFQNPKIFDNNRFPYNQPINFPNRFQNGFVSNEQHRFLEQPRQQGNSFFPNQRQPHRTYDIVSHSRIRGLPEGQNYFAM